MGHAVRDIGRNVAGYLFILTCINVGVAVVTAIAFYAAGISNAVVWGVVFGLANYVPVIGPTGTILAAGVVGVANEATLLQGLIAPGIMLVINAIESQAVQPWLMARRIEINPVAMFVALAFVVWLWGIPAALISTPMLIVAYTFSKYAPPLEPIAVALAPVTKPKHEPPPPPSRAKRTQAERARAAKAAA
jgi:predicted PurR-regulated permease PerM